LRRSSEFEVTRSEPLERATVGADDIGVQSLGVATRRFECPDFIASARAFCERREFCGGFALI